MADEILIRVAREGLYLALLLSAPIVLITLITSLVTGVLQAATQLQGPTLQTAPRIIIAAVVLLIFAPWMGQQLLRFTEAVFQYLPAVAW